MSWRDRPYAGDDDSMHPQMRFSFRKPSTAVMWLIIANVAVFFIQAVASNWSHAFFPHTFGLSLKGIYSFFLWQPITYMFLHGGGWHLLFNVFGLYIFGSEFERAFGKERLLQFYATCGLVGGIAYLVLALINPFYAHVPLIGASGAIYGLLVAAIIFFPHIQIIVIIFPMPIRVFGLILAAFLLLQIISPGRIENLGGEVCHVAGALTGLAIFYSWGMMPKVRIGSGKGPVARRWRKLKEGAWVHKQQILAEEQAEVDRILQKVHENGLQSLTHKEKNILARTTKRQKDEDRRSGRIDRL